MLEVVKSGNFTEARLVAFMFPGPASSKAKYILLVERHAHNTTYSYSLVWLIGLRFW